MQRFIYFTQRQFVVVLLINALLIELNAHSHDGVSSASESSLGTYMIKSPESTDAPPGDEVQLQCELNLPPEKLEWRFRPQNSNPNDRDGLINIHKMVTVDFFYFYLSTFFNDDSSHTVFADHFSHHRPVITSHRKTNFQNCTFL